MGSPGSGDASAVTGAGDFALRPVAFQLESRSGLDAGWRVEALDIVYGLSAGEVARSMARDFALSTGVGCGWRCGTCAGSSVGCGGCPICPQRGWPGCAAWMTTTFPRTARSSGRRAVGSGD